MGGSLAGQLLFAKLALAQQRAQLARRHLHSGHSWHAGTCKAGTASGDCGRTPIHSTCSHQTPAQSSSQTRLTPAAAPRSAA